MALPRDVISSISSQAPKILKNDLISKSRAAGEIIKKQLIVDFLSHPVTRELQAGPSASNTSGTLGGVGNLFVFIGFEKGYDPIEPILSRLESIIFTFSGFTKGGIIMSVSLPDAQEIFSITPMPWASGRSWAKGIETGISGLGFLLNKEGIFSSRSGGAIQSENKLRSGVKFSNTQYISALLNKYRKIFLSNETVISA
jgi:hypothetical protein